MRRLGFTILELLVVIVILTLLIVLFLPTLKTATDGTKHISCMTNMRELSIAWIGFANDNHSNLVNGEGGCSKNKYGRYQEAWVGKCWANNYASGGQVSVSTQVQRIQEGALYPYANDLRIYRCPTGYDGEMLTYAIMDSMNGLTNGRGNVHQPGVFIKKLFEIPMANKRIVFIDEGFVTPDSYAVHFDRQEWWDDVPIRHGDGTTVAFADGHSERWIFEGDDTIERGIATTRAHPGNNWRPSTEAGCYDLYKMQIATWGRLDYNNQYPLGVFDLKPKANDPVLP